MSKVIKVSGKTRDQFIESMKGKGEEYLASKLFDVRADNIELRRDISYGRQQDIRCHEEADRLETINRNLAMILEKNGIRPVQLRIKFTTEDCSACEYGFRSEWEWECANEDDPNHDCPEKTILTSEAFYYYNIEDDELTGIISDFTNESYDVLEVVDERTGKTIWKKPKEKKD